MDSSQLTLTELKVAASGNENSVIVNNGMIDLILDGTTTVQNFNVTQPYGAICMAGAAKKVNSVSGCPTEEERAQEIIVKAG